MAVTSVSPREKPICVESCPLRALDFRPIAELRAKHGQLAAVAPLPSAHFTRPSIVIKPNANARPCGDTTGYPRTRRRCEMGNGWHEWPLVLFTVLGQCVVGATIVSGLGWLALGTNGSPAAAGAQYVFIWLLMGIGFLASVMHLGSPLRAFNSLNRIGASALTTNRQRRSVLRRGRILVAAGGAGKMPATLGKVWLAIVMLLGLLFVLAMTRVYQIIPCQHGTMATPPARSF